MGNALTFPTIINHKDSTSLKIIQKYEKLWKNRE